MKENLNDHIITTEMNNIRIIVDNVIIDNYSLKWIIEKDNSINEQHEFLTLGDIYKQCYCKYNCQIIYVWEESPLEGVIWMCGNYNDGEWVKQGTTRGFA